MRIWVISSSYPRRPGESINAGVVARDLALEIADRGHEVTVFTPDKPGGVVFDAEIAGVTMGWFRPSIQISDLSRGLVDLVRAISLMVSARVAMRRETRRCPPDGIIALWGLPSGIFARWAGRSARCPYVVWLLGSDVWRSSEIPGGTSTLRRVNDDAAAVFADGRELADEAVRITGVSTAFLPSVRRLPPAVPGSRRPIDLVYVGRYHPNKGPDVLLDALALLTAQGLAFSAVLHGSGDLQDELQGRLVDDELNRRVELSPPIDAQGLADLLGRSRFLVIPSRIESIPLILGDSVQAKTPVIATRVGDMGTLVEELGIGVTAEPGDPEDLARAIAGALVNGIAVSDWSRAEELLTPGAASTTLLNALGIDSAQPGTQ